MSTLNLGVIGNCSFSALIDEKARIVWSCMPRFDGDPVFHELVNSNGSQAGFFDVALENYTRSEQMYLRNTAVLRTVLHDNNGSSVEIIDFAPRFYNRGRMFRPNTLVRRIRPLHGNPRIRIRMRPRFEYGSVGPQITHGSNHVRYVSSGLTLRLTTNAPVSYVLQETPFVLQRPLDLVLGPDETLQNGIEDTARDFEERTTEYWRVWVRRLALPIEWQEAVIRAAITLKLCAFEETGAIIAAMTTSIPEAPDSQRNWDYRYCWLRDAFFVVRALNALAEVETMEDFHRYMTNIVGMARDDGHLQPVYGIGLESELTERTIDNFVGYRGMGPVRVGNQAYEHYQHDVYGNVILAESQAFFDSRLLKSTSYDDFWRLETVGEQAFRLYDQADAGMWELRTRARVHTSSSLMCWAACDRLSKIAHHIRQKDRAIFWRHRADTIKDTILKRSWNDKIGAFVESFDGDGLDASLLLMAEVGFIDPMDPRFQSTVKAIERGLKKGHHLYRYQIADDFGVPENAFNICTFWYIDALVRTGRMQEAREIFETMLSCRNHLGLLSEDVNPQTGELWGNFPQTYSLVGIINAARGLSARWEERV